MLRLSVNRRQVSILYVLGIALLSGCAMCKNPFDCDYAAYGSRLPRADMARGRVGSILDGSSAGVVTTQPIDDDGLSDGLYEERVLENGAFQDQDFGQNDFNDRATLHSSQGQSELYESPVATLSPQNGSAPARQQIDQTLDAINRELHGR